MSERVLARELAAIPRWYNPYMHLVATTGIGLLTLLVSLAMVHRVRAVELLLVPAIFLLSNAIEWMAHRDVLHRRVWPVGELYERHTPIHHTVYQYDSMAMRSVRELRLVLMPATGVLTVIAISAPIAFAIARLLTHNCGWLGLATASVYVVGYELTHLAYHMPEDSFVGRLGFVRVLREHHRRHHHPALMQKWNFNVTVPIFDWVRGTLASPEVVTRAVARSRHLSG
ncbi:MAG: sterol desaturase family protein [Polyangiaceae bacterium]